MKNILKKFAELINELDNTGEIKLADMGDEILKNPKIESIERMISKIKDRIQEKHKEKFSGENTTEAIKNLTERLIELKQELKYLNKNAASELWEREYTYKETNKLLKLLERFNELKKTGVDEEIEDIANSLMHKFDDLISFIVKLFNSDARERQLNESEIEQVSVQLKVLNQGLKSLKDFKKELTKKRRISEEVIYPGKIEQEKQKIHPLIKKRVDSELLKNLIKVANYLDQNNNFEEADQIDSLIKALF